MNKQLLQNIDFYRQKLQTYYRLSPDMHKNLNRHLKPHLLSTCCALGEIPATQEDRILGLSKAYDYMVQEADKGNTFRLNSVRTLYSLFTVCSMRIQIKDRPVNIALMTYMYSEQLTHRLRLRKFLT